jgi:hypothetical protein
MNDSDINLILSWEEFQVNHKVEETLQLIEPGDNVTIRGNHYTIIAPSNDGKSIWLSPHEGFLGDRVFSIDVVIEGIDNNLIIERRLNKLKLEEKG